MAKKQHPRFDNILSISSDVIAVLPVSASTGGTIRSKQTPVATSFLEPKVSCTPDMPEKPQPTKLNQISFES